MHNDGRVIEVVVVGGDELDARIVTRELEGEGLMVRLRRTWAAGERRPEDDFVDVAVACRAADARVVEDARRTFPSAQIVAICAELDMDRAGGMLDAGASAVLDEESWAAAIGPVTRSVLAGQVCVPAAVRELARPAVTLSLRERQVLALMASGLTNCQIANRLYLSESTVKSHAVKAFRRLGVHSRREAVAMILGGNEALRRTVLTVQAG